MQGAIGVERQLPHNTTVAVTYTNNRSNHLPQTVPINTPLPGTYNPLLRPGPAMASSRTAMRRATCSIRESAAV